ncbi:MAG TPA: hypothetical protein VIF15_10735 [Polyangiaceae bacterium]|jgi:hypothetical protein
MPIAFAPFVALALGAVLAWIAAPELARVDGPIVASRPFAVVAAFAGLVWVPAVGYFLVFHGDWSYLYFVPWQRVPSAIDLGLALLAGAAVLGGFWLTVKPVRKRRSGPVVAMVVAPGVLAMVGVMLAARRLAVSGTYAQFHGDFGTEPIGASALGKGVLLMAVVLTLGVAWTVRALLHMAAEARS